MSTPALWTMYAKVRYQEKLDEAEKARRVRTFKAAAPQPQQNGRSPKAYWLKPRFRPTMAK